MIEIIDISKIISIINDTIVLIIISSYKFQCLINCNKSLSYCLYTYENLVFTAVSNSPQSNSDRSSNIQPIWYPFEEFELQQLPVSWKAKY